MTNRQFISLLGNYLLNVEKMIQHIRNIVRTLIQIDPTVPLHQVPVYKKVLRFMYTVWKVFLRTSGFQRAAALAFATLFGIFPLIAVLLFLVPVFFGSAEMQKDVGEVILNYILPATSDMESTLNHYIAIYQTRATQIGVMGLIALLGAGIALFIIVEQSFNDIWRVQRKRSFLKASTVFAGVIVWMPLFIGLSIYLTTEFLTRTQAEVSSFKNVFPITLVFLGFSLAYFLIPNTRVEIIPAVTGALFAALVWEMARTLFDRSMKFFPTLNIVQSIGAIPYFLVWLYINWIIILVGVIIAYCLQNYHLLLREDIAYNARILDPVVLLMMLFHVGKNFMAGRGAVSMVELRNICPLPAADFLQHLGYLEKLGFIILNNDSETVLLAQPPEKIPIESILQFSSKAKTMFHLSVIDEAGQQFLARLQQMDQNMTASLTDKSLSFFLS